MAADRPAILAPPLATAVLAGLAGLLPPAGSQAREWTLTPSVTTTATATDNIEFEPDGEPGLIFTVAPAVLLVGEGPRSELALSLGLFGQYDTLDGLSAGVMAGGAATGTAELVTDRLFVDAAALIDQEVVDVRQGASRRSFADDNLTTVQRYRVSPYYRFAFGDTAESETRANLGYVAVGDFDEGTLSYGIAQEVASGPAFQRTLWSALARIQEDRDLESDRRFRNRFTGTVVPLDERRTTNTLLRGDVERIVNDNWSLIGSLGYESIRDDRITEDLEGPLWNVGFIYRIRPDLRATVSYGQRFEHTNAFVDVEYALTARTDIEARYERSFGTREQMLLGELDRIAIGPDGQLIDSRTGLPITDEFDALGIRTDEFVVEDRYTLRAVTQAGRNTYSPALFYTRTESLETDLEESAYGASFTWNRRINPQLDGNFAIQFEHLSLSDGEDINDYFLGIGVVRRISASLTATAGYLFRYRDREFTGDVHENAITISLRKTF